MSRSDSKRPEDAVPGDRRSLKWLWWSLGGLGLAAAVAVAAALSGGAPAVAPSAGGDPILGEASFLANCSECHGVEGVGTDSGPPLVHDYYLPNHHADVAFTLAARVGVPSHHWDFGSMPPVDGVTDDELSDIVAYVRDLQRRAGLLADS